ncbi:hypothetical protein HK405_014680 [Cladochytrium tenue]|nr:hypothetical protein HK405_014680 [Cladochytrium tenue]
MGHVNRREKEIETKKPGLKGLLQGNKRDARNEEEPEAEARAAALRKKLSERLRLGSSSTVAFHRVVATNMMTENSTRALMYSINTPHNSFYNVEK